MGIVGRILNLQCGVCDDSTHTATVLLHLWGEVVMGVVGTWLPWVCEALQLQHTCWNRESIASCHHSSTGKGDSTVCGKAPLQAGVLLRPPPMDSLPPPTPSASGPPQQSTHPTGAGGLIGGAWAGAGGGLASTERADCTTCL